MDTSSFSFYEDLLRPVGLSGVGAFIALWAKDQFSKSGEKRKLRSEELTFLCERIDLCRTLSSEYWQSCYKDGLVKQKAIEARITGLFHGCNEILSQTGFEQLSDKTNISNKINEMRRIVTSSNFGQIDRLEDCDKLKDIESLGHEVHALVVAAKRK